MTELYPNLIMLGTLGAAIMAFILLSGPSVRRYKTDFDDFHLQAIIAGLCFCIGVIMLFWALLMFPLLSLFS